jgi:hypothetical protein
LELIQRIARGVNAYEASMARRCGVTVEYLRKEMGIASKIKRKRRVQPKDQ